MKQAYVEQSSNKIYSMQRTQVKPYCLVEPLKMNVFYIGVVNPIELICGGYSEDDLNLTLSPSTHGTIYKENGHYYVTVVRAGRCSIIVTRKSDNQLVSNSEFRVKTVPDPFAQVLGMNGGKIDKARLQAAPTLDAKMKDFDFDISFKVVSFSIRAQVGAYFLTETIQGNSISHSAKQNIFSKLSKGSIVYFDDIIAVGPDGRERRVSPLKFEIL